jgi:hypothetical protein
MVIELPGTGEVAPSAHHRRCINAQQRRFCSLNFKAMRGADGRLADWAFSSVARLVL